MPEQHFTLTMRCRLNDQRLDALVEAGCDDATFSTKGELSFAEFDREAPSLVDAIASAIASVEGVNGIEVLRVDPDDLVWASEIAQRTGRTRASVDHLIRGVSATRDRALGHHRRHQRCLTGPARASYRRPAGHAAAGAPTSDRLVGSIKAAP